MVRVIAHRGASAAAPENTLEAFLLARELGADWVELDARRTGDGAIVVHHDAALADGRLLVALRAAEVPAEVPDLASAFDACAGMGVNVEIKNLAVDPDHDPSELVAAEVAAEVRRRSLHDRVIVSSFSRAALRAVRSVDPEIPTALLHLAGHDPVALAAHAAEAGHRALHPWDPVVDAAYVEAAQAHGLEVNVWTVDDAARMAELVALGVHGLCTNVPDVARGVVDAGVTGAAAGGVSG